MFLDKYITLLAMIRMKMSMFNLKIIVERDSHLNLYIVIYKTNIL